MNIWQISQELQSVIDELEENGGELTEDLEDRLTVSQADFKTKVKSYGEVIKHIEGDIKLIDEEIARLKDLKESKKKAIDRLSKVIIWAIDMFGETTKSGGKFVDYGTGKISVRNTEKVEVDTDATDTAVKNFLSYLSMLDYTNELDNYNGISPDSVIEALKEGDTPVSLTPEELNTINASFSFDIPLNTIMYGKGFEFIRHFTKFISSYKAKSNMNKTELKNVLKEDVTLPHIASIVKNQTISIK